MARPIKKGLHYFPLDVDMFYDPKIEDLLEDHGPVGLAIYQAALCLVYSAGYYLAAPLDTVARSIQRMIGSKWVRRRDTVIQVIRSCADIGLFDSALLSQDVITSVGIQSRYAEAVSRSGAQVDKYSLIDSHPKKRGSDEAGGSAPEKGVFATETGVFATETPVSSTETNTKEEEIKEDSSSLAHVRARESKLDLLKLSDGEAEQLVQNLPKAKMDHYCDVILHCEAEGKRFRKQTHFEAVRAMAIADGVWGARHAPKKTASCKTQSFDPEAAWQKALEKSYGGG